VSAYPKASVARPAVLVLADGTVFEGRAIGIDAMAVGEVVFNTSMTGYQEILTDPSYAQQMVTLTYPHIGSTGANTEDVESEHVYCTGLIIKDLPRLHSNFRAAESLEAFLNRHQVVAIADIDTRALTRHLRDNGAQSGCILAAENPDASAALGAAQAFPGLSGMDLAKEVTCKEPYTWSRRSWQLSDSQISSQTGNQTNCPYRRALRPRGRTWWQWILASSTTSFACLLIVVVVSP